MSTPSRTSAGAAPREASSALPSWARTVAESYESNAASQFVIYGNINDRMVLPVPPAPRLAALPDFLLGVLLSGFNVVLSYDLGNGIRVEKVPKFSPNGRTSKRARRTGKRRAPPSRRSLATSATAPTSRA